MLPENNILMLQELFWQPGKHHLKVQTFHEGRKIIDTFLNALNYYKKIACLTTEAEKIPQNYHNIYPYFHPLSKFTPFQQENYIESFLLEQSDYDFMWIEMSDDLCKKVWFKLLEKKLVEFKLAETHPVLIIESLSKK